jgi:TrmH family RNA methyltransferase
MIESSQNPKFKLWKSLFESKGIKKEGLALVFGEKVVAELTKTHRDHISELILSGGKHLGFHPSVKASFLSHDLFQELDLFGTNTPILVMKTASFEAWDAAQPAKGLQLLLPFGDPANLGAALRNAAAFAVNEVVLLEESCNPFLPKCSRAASGANWNLKFLKGPSIKDLGDIENLIAFDLEGEDLNNFNWPQDLRLLVGDEGPGVPKSIRVAQRIKITTSDKVESLNAVAASSIALFSYRSQHQVPRERQP